jgi:DNA repair protein RadC
MDNKNNFGKRQNGGDEIKILLAEIRADNANHPGNRQSFGETQALLAEIQTDSENNFANRQSDADEIRTLFAEIQADNENILKSFLSDGDKVGSSAAEACADDADSPENRKSDADEIKTLFAEIQADGENILVNRQSDGEMRAFLAEIQSESENMPQNLSDDGGEIKNPAEIHKDHRSRLRRQLLDGGIESCPDHQILEYFLFPFIPRRDTNVIAHELMNKFGSLSAVFDADFEELRTVGGMTEIAAANIALHYKITARISHDKAKKNDCLNTSYAVFKYVKSFMSNLKTEQAYLLCLNSGFKLIRRVLLQSGIVNQTAIYLRQIAEVALQCGATNIVVVHNHPSGDVRPSKNDIEASVEMLSVFPVLEINLLDHIIVGPYEEYYSFRENEQFLKIRKGMSDKYRKELNDAFNIWNREKKDG